jgi:hypothetical protein
MQVVFDQEQLKLCVITHRASPPVPVRDLVFLA